MAEPLLNIEQVVSDRYSAASRAAETSLCCSVEYERRYLEVLPQEIIDRDYGCGDPSRHVREGECVLDLGCGGGKICYIASQIVGPRGRVIGVDMNDDMLALARRHQEETGRRIGWHNVSFRKGRIQDLGLDLEQFDARLRDSPVRSVSDWLAAQGLADQLRRGSPLVPDESVDVVLSNCVLNLVAPGDRRQLFRELYRVLRPGGRAVISDIVSDVEVPPRLRSDARLWSGCISGAFVEHDFPDQFVRAGFRGVEILARQDPPWTIVAGIAFRSLTVRAFKPPAGRTLQTEPAVIYRGPWASVADEEGQVLRRGIRTPVSTAQCTRFASEPYARDVVVVQRALPEAEAPGACCGPAGCPADEYGR